MYIGHFYNSAFNKRREAQSVEHQTTDLRAVGSNPTMGKNFHFVFCRSRRAPCRSTGPIQIKSSITFILGIKVHRDNDHLKEKWRRY